MQELNTSRDWAAALGVTTRWVTQRVSAGTLPPPDFTASTTGGGRSTHLWYPSTLRTWLEQQAAAKSEPAKP